MAEKQKVNLRFKPKGTEGLPVQPLEVNQPTFRGTLPFSVGGAMAAPGSAPIPDSIRQEQRAVVESQADIPEEVRRRAEQLMAAQQKVINMADLPPEKQEEILAAIGHAARMQPPPPMTTPQPTYQQPQQMPQQQRQVMQQPMQPQMAPVPQQMPPQQPQQQQQAPPQQPRFIPRDGSIGMAKMLADKVVAQQEARDRQQALAPQQAPQQTPQAQPAQAEPEPEPVAPLQDLRPTNCMHCGWPVDSLDMCSPDTLDKQVFVASVLGQKRFSKEFQIFDGKMRITFRSLTVEENDLVVKQLMKDWNDGKITGPAHSIAEATKYQLALGLESVSTSVGQVTLPEYSDYDDDDPKEGNTILPKIVEYVTEHAMPNEPTRRIIAKAYGHFVTTQSKLEAMAEQPDFWKATGV